MNSQNFSRTNSFQTTFFLLLSIFIISTFISCEKESTLDEPAPDIIIGHSPDLYVGNISGKVLNESLEALAGVNIDIGGEETVTDDNGFFNLQGIQLDANGTLINASRDGYWPITKMVTLTKTQQNQTRIVLLPKTETRNIEASAGGMVSFNDTVKVYFQANSFVTSTGEAYEGSVEISAIHLDPGEENFGMKSPGDFRAFNADSELQTLLSLGMAGVELKGINNEILELKTDKSATLYIKVPDGSNEEEVLLWHFDETSGYWLEAGIAQREGDFFEGEVSHFSWWDFGIPFFAVKLSGAVLNETGMGVSGLPVSVILADQDQDLGTEYTGGEGLFCGWIPKDQDLIMQIRNECGDVFYEEAIGAFSEDTELSAITLSGQHVIEVCGNMVDCNSEAVTHGYLVVQHGLNKTFIPVDTMGNFCSAVNICESTTFGLYGIDLTSGLQGVVSTYNLDDSPVNNLEVSACDELAILFSFQIDDEQEIQISDFTISMNDGTLGCGASSELYGMIPYFIIDGINWGTDDFDFGYFDVNIASPSTEIECDFAECNEPNVAVIEYGGVGNPIILQIIGTSWNDHDYIINVTGILE